MLAHVVLTMAASAAVASSVTNGWDRDVALKRLWYSFATYDYPKDIKLWNCTWCQKATAEKVDASVQDVIADSDTFTLSTVTTVTEPGQRPLVVVAFRGTVSLANWISNANFVMADCSVPEAPPKCKAHAGFQSSYMALRDDLQASLRKAFASDHCKQGCGAIFTGHSLGGALATYGAIDAVNSLNQSDVELWTFGGPREGNPVHQQWLKDSVPITWRMVNWQDIVPHLPPEWTGYHHWATEVFYNQSLYDPANPSWQVCDGSGEDNSCSDQFFAPTSIDNHTCYMGQDLETDADAIPDCWSLPCPPPDRDQFDHLYRQAGATMVRDRKHRSK